MACGRGGGCRIQSGRLSDAEMTKIFKGLQLKNVKADSTRAGDRRPELITVR
ncbi:hypothetical protein AB0C07_14390 [Actinoplanes missouriensis]|uniref:hypothetical protein n=1 Tax=Actinoplanes missouriensis TaxID=1866 RepID=UPI0033EEFBFA